MTQPERSKWWRPYPSWAGAAVVVATAILVVKLGFIIGLLIGLVLAGGIRTWRAFR